MAAHCRSRCRISLESHASVVFGLDDLAFVRIVLLNAIAGTPGSPLAAVDEVWVCSALTNVIEHGYIWIHFRRQEPATSPTPKPAPTKKWLAAGCRQPLLR